MSGRSILRMDVVGTGRTTKIYRDGDRAFKLYPNASITAANEEAAKQRFAKEAGLPVPNVYGLVAFDEGIAIEMDYLPGIPIGQPGMSVEDRHNAMNELISLQRIVHSLQADGLPRLTDCLRKRIEQSVFLEVPVITTLLKHLQAIGHGAIHLCHGDFHALNIIRCEGKLWIIDWVDAAAGNPLADACRTYLIFKQYISRMADMYLRQYCKAASMQQQDVLIWLPIVAAARLQENLTPKERDFLLQIIAKVP